MYRHTDKMKKKIENKQKMKMQQNIQFLIH